ncbi:MAG: ABC transporter ATP-binding protein [Chloroflexota bacterium]|nr:ABC transporter ATP-binding protein [Chloroflexota bacterium]
MATILTVENVEAGYGDVTIVHGVSLRVDESEIVAIVGPNGSGKSTLIKSLLGFAKIFNGRVIYQERDITGITSDKAVKLGIAYVPQSNNVFANLTVNENLEMGAYIRRDGTSIKSDINDIYRLFPELEARKKAWAGNLSGGERQMLAMARAMMAAPRVMLLDEPLASVSPKAVSTILSKIEDVRQSGVAIVMIEQNVKKALDNSHRGYILVEGVCVMEGESKSILSDSDVKHRYLGLDS